MTAPIGGGVTAADGFRAAAVACGLKKDALDLALIAAGDAVSAAAVFTTNLVVAAPVLVAHRHLAASGGRSRVIAVNSGCANACTGAAGMAAAEAMAAVVAREIDCPLEQVLIASTGVIGQHLDSAKIARGVAAAAPALRRDAHGAAAAAIMTTDVAPKEAALRVDTPAGPFTIGGMVKGAGMIEPNMATMLGFLTTDAAVEPARLQRALSAAVADTFNAITVDGESSTNDAVFLLASGASGVAIDDATHAAFVDALRAVCRTLAREIVRGGEGATKLVTVRVTGAGSDADARRAARDIANSLLVKTALNGGDPNWGRLIAVAGRAGVALEPARAQVRIGPAVLFADDTVFEDREPAAAAHLAGGEVEVAVDLGTGGGHDATVWTCDLSAEYVRINADYRT